MTTLVQFDFPSNGPWGQEMAAAYEVLAADIAEAAGLIWKIWTENAETGMAGGIYLFDNAEHAQAYIELHSRRLAGFGVTDIRALTFEVNETLSRTTRGPLGG